MKSQSHADRHIWTLACVDIIHDSERQIDTYFNVFETYIVPARLNSDETQKEVESKIENFPISFKLLTCWNHLPKNGREPIDTGNNCIISFFVEGPNEKIVKLNIEDKDARLRTGPISRVIVVDIVDPPYLGSGVYWYIVNFRYPGEESQQHRIPIQMAVDFVAPEL